MPWIMFTDSKYMCNHKIKYIVIFQLGYYTEYLSRGYKPTIVWTQLSWHMVINNG